MYNNFAKYCLTHGAYINWLEIPGDQCGHLGLCNPSVFIDGDDIRVILRNVNYMLWSSLDEHRYTGPYGPLYYVTPDNDQHLRTRNFLGVIKDDSAEYKLIDTSACDWEAQWDFVGHEDMRLVRWDGKLYGTGVQRDWNATGIGRMHLSEIEPKTGKELNRVRLAAPGSNDGYCEKNWMPVLDMPYHYIRWCNPLELVKVNPETGESETVKVVEYPKDTVGLNVDGMPMRGSSQVITWGDYRIAIVHFCRLELNEKKEKVNPIYTERFIVWDKDWNIVRATAPFKFANFNIEFTNGLAYKDDTFYIPFALQDNMAFMLRVNEDVVRKFIFDSEISYGNYNLTGNVYLEFFNNTTDSYALVKMAEHYFSNGLWAAACVCYERACDYNTFKYRYELYNAVLMTGQCIARIGKRDAMEKHIWFRLINMCPERSEGYLMLARYYIWRNCRSEAYAFAKLAYEKNNFRQTGVYSPIKDENDVFIDYMTAKYWTEQYAECEKEIDIFLKTHNCSPTQIISLKNILNMINTNKPNRKRIL